MSNIFGREPLNEIRFINPVTKKVLYKAFEFFTLYLIGDYCDKLIKKHNLVEVCVEIYMVGELKKTYLRQKYGNLKML